MNKFDEPFNIRLTPNYSLGEPTTYGEIIERNEQSELLGGIPSTIPEEDNEQLVRFGGGFDWQLYRGEGSKPLVNIQLMRLWCVQMFNQIARDKAFVNEVESGIEVGLSEEEVASIENVCYKIFDSLHKELYHFNESFVVKSKIKKVEI